MAYTRQMSRGDRQQYADLVNPVDDPPHRLGLRGGDFVMVGLLWAILNKLEKIEAELTKK